MMEWLKAHPVTIVGLVLWAVGVLWLMPGRSAGVVRPRLPGLLATGVGVFLFCFSCGRPESEFADEVMFWVFGLGALLSGVLMITARNPVYAALWFALATLSTCGLFLLQSAPFLAAATIIVYAGAVIVTFLFVIMLAQQSGAAGYDQRSVNSSLATIGSFVLLGALSMTLGTRPPQLREADSPVAASASSGETASASRGPMVRTLTGKKTIPPMPGNLLSKADERHPVGELKGLGRSLFGDYLFAVELAGTLLLIASIGAIAIAPRREQGGL